jgi:hypothetical protein
VLWSPYGNEGMGYNNFVCVESVKVRFNSSVVVFLLNGLGPVGGPVFLEKILACFCLSLMVCLHFLHCSFFF